MAQQLQSSERHMATTGGGRGRRQPGKDIWTAEYVGGSERWRYHKVEDPAGKAAVPGAVPRQKEMRRAESDPQLEMYKRLGFTPGILRRLPAESLLSEYIRPEWRAFANPMPNIQAPAAKLDNSPMGGASRSFEIQTLKDIRVLKFSQGERLYVKRWQLGHSLKA